VSLIDFARENPATAALLLGSAASFSCSVVLKGLRRAFPEPDESLPRWLRFVEGCLDAIAANSRRPVSLKKEKPQ
jgi:hypothetical protein